MLEVVLDNAKIQVHCHVEPPPLPSGDYELVIYPTSMTSEGSSDGRHIPFTVGTAATALIDGDDASYGWATWLRTVKGVYPVWSTVAPTEPAGLTSIDPSWVTAIGTRFRAKINDNSFPFQVALFAQTSKLLTQATYGGEDHSLTFTASDTWQNFDVVFDDAEYDLSGWAPSGVQSALSIGSYLYTRTNPLNPSDHTLLGDAHIQVSEQCLVIYFTIP